MRKFKPASLFRPHLLFVWAGLFAVIGVATLLALRAATQVTIDSSLPNPTNLRVFGDDRVATIQWDEPANASSKGIVGYYVTYGEQSKGVYTNAKQTTHTIHQLQPLTNGVTYNVKVQSVHGSYVNVPVNAHEANSAREARASGRVSPGVTATVTPSSARVDQLRQQMTGFFDDFNLPTGALDELKWNTATSACVGTGGGSFINNQFHAHTQVKSDYCDRSQMAQRARAVFDITGKTESNPGVMVMDFDGVAHGRDFWYIDLIPVDARKNGAPLDITEHASAFDDETSDPKMIRFVQQQDGFHFSYYDNNKDPRQINATFSCPDWAGNVDFAWCQAPQTPGLSPLPEPNVLREVDEHPDKQIPVENVRHHWRFEFSPTKIKVFINSSKVWEGPMPADFANVKQYVVHNNLFSYNTGKMDDTHPTTSLLHWDNFGFNGPAPTTVVHNYLEGGSTGNTPYLGLGTDANLMPGSPRTTKVNIPDPIGSPKQARVMFTINNNGPGSYDWSSADHIVVNGKRYNFPNPRTDGWQPPILDHWYGIADSIDPHATSIIVNAADLKQGVNDIALNFSGHYMNLMNVHVELEYNKGTEPNYTQPKQIYGENVLNSFIMPTMTSHDTYLFIEQNMGLQSGVISGDPTPSDTTAPTVSIASPTNGSSVTKGSSLAVNITASDNVGVDKVELYLDGARNTTITHSPFNHTLDTSSWATGNHTLMARAFDAAGNNTASSQITISISDPAPADTTGPTVSVTAPASGQSVSGTISVSANATDPSGVSNVRFYLDGSSTALATDNQSPYTFQWNSASIANGSHTITARATDSLGNQTTSGGISFTVNNVTPDTTAPSTNITSPVNGTTINGTVTVASNASDNVGVSKVELIVDNTVLTPADTTSPYQFSWSTTGYAPGTHSLRTRATDAAGNTSLSSIVTVTIPDTTAPITGITAPIGGTTVSGTVNVAATASDNVGVSKVEFVVDGSVVSTDPSSPYSFGWVTTGVSNAVHTLQTRATDAAGNIGQSIPIVVTVNNVLTPPPTTPPTPKTGDVNNDGRVSIFDLQILISNWRRSDATAAQGDLNGDGTVNIFDLQILINNWGR